MYRTQYFRIQHVGSGDDDTFVPEIVPKMFLYPGGVLTENGTYRHIEFDLIDFFPPKQQSKATDKIQT